MKIAVACTACFLICLAVGVAPGRSAEVRPLHRHRRRRLRAQGWPGTDDGRPYAAENPKGIGIVLVSSGGWRSKKSNVLSDEERGRQREHWVQGLLGGGYTLFVARHGSGPRTYVPEMVEDIRRAVRYTRLHAADYGVDPDHLGITSGSSGGHLALMVGLTGDDGKSDAKDPVEQQSSRVQAIVAWFPPTDMINWGTADGYKSIEEKRPGLLKEMFGNITDPQAQ